MEVCKTTYGLVYVMGFSRFVQSFPNWLDKIFRCYAIPWATEIGKRSIYAIGEIIVVYISDPRFLKNLVFKLVLRLFKIPVQPKDSFQNYKIKVLYGQLEKWSDHCKPTFRKD